ncbi:MAG: MBL fold metallo-hydrolase [Firmicutes bacterium]|nr:MBL fold metallo-hydrolase [Bacillota bacterium]
MKKTKKLNSKIIIALATILLAVFAIMPLIGCDFIWGLFETTSIYNIPPVVSPPDDAFDGGLRVTFLDVGQADAAVVQFPEGQKMLIDAGRWNLTHNRFRQDVRAFFPIGQRMQFDWFIATHSHADHIGSAAYIVQNSYIQNVIRTKTFTNDEIASGAYREFGIPEGEARLHETATHRNLVTALQTSTWHDGTDTNIYIPRAGKYFYVGNTPETRARVTFYSPTTHRYSGAVAQINRYSTIFCIYFNGRRIMFTGDSYVYNENNIMNSLPTNIDVLDVSHHGSNTSTGEAFVNRLNPTYAIIQVGTTATGNSYHHPHHVVLNRLTAVNATVYRTDMHGAIVVDISVCGTHLQVSPSRI